jgi:hypothetical protein
MSKPQMLILNPMMVHQDSLLTIQNTEGHFENNDYIIKNEFGIVIRKGNLSNSFFGFQIRIIGMKSGFYHFIMGNQSKQFQVI